MRNGNLGQFDMVFADPPYFLSNGGFSVHAGKCVSVDKGEWDKSSGFYEDAEFTYAWLSACRDLMSEKATIWVCGTFHNIFTVANVLSELNFRILNSIVWQKTNPPPNLSCRMFTHSTEFIVWARKSKKVPHYYNYDLMHKIAGGRQMTDVWRLPAIGRWEKLCGKHPAQKPISLVVRAILSSTVKGERILDPFAGSSTTGIAANLLDRDFVGIEQSTQFLNISKERYEALLDNREVWRQKIPDLKMVDDISYL
jgi:site-specific DNA-methyltransferase (adenine-specific)